MTYYVYLNSKYDEYAVTEEAYAQICALVHDNKLCTSDYRDPHPYTQDNPCVGKNICLVHMSKKHPHLTYTGTWAQWRSGKNDGALAHVFVDEKGYVYLSTEDNSTDLQRSIGDTLSYYGFIAPTQITSRGKSVDFYPHYARLHGDFKTASVIVMAYEHHSEKVKGLFLLYKNNAPRELSRKSDLYARADELVESSKDAQGEYHINGYSHTTRYEADVFEVISQLESAMYDVTLRLKNGNQGTDNRTGEEA